MPGSRIEIPCIYFLYGAKTHKSSVREKNIGKVVFDAYLSFAGIALVDLILL